MNKYNKTPIIFSIQEDTIILNGKNIDMELIYDKLLHTDNVEYVKFYVWSDITVLPGQERAGRSVPGDYRPETLPATPHPDTELLYKCLEWSDRPHFATIEHYNNRVWKNIGENSRATMEQHIKWAAKRSGKFWGTWIYGNRYSMNHEQDVSYLASNNLQVSFHVREGDRHG